MITIKETEDKYYLFDERSQSILNNVCVNKSNAHGSWTIKCILTDAIEIVNKPSNIIVLLAQKKIAFFNNNNDYVIAEEYLKLNPDIQKDGEEILAGKRKRPSRKLIAQTKYNPSTQKKRGRPRKYPIK